MKRSTALFLVCSACSGGSSGSPAATSAGDERTHYSPTDTPHGTVTAKAFVETLLALARGANPGAVEAYVDRDFSERLPSGRPLEDLLRPFDPARCTLDEGPGYDAVAIPPPMDEPEDEAARIQALIDELQASTEVMATCTEIESTQESVDEPATEETVSRPLFALSVRRREDGSFRALAWRYFPDDVPGNW